MKEQLGEHRRLVDLMDAQTDLLEQVAKRMLDGFADGATLFILGNGGSAADAQHIAAELVGRFKKDRKALPAVALTTDTSVLTAVTNDLGGEEIFVRQVQALVRKGDLVWALSVSGTSANVIKAVELAKAQGAFIIGFTGSGGGKLASLSDLCFMVDHASSDRVQETHQLAYHLVCEWIEGRI